MNRHDQPEGLGQVDAANTHDRPLRVGVVQQNLGLMQKRHDPVVALNRLLAIDPKPVHGDLAYDPWPLLTQVGDWVDTAAAPDDLADRTRLVADLTGLDAARIASWCTARSLASGLWAADRGWWTGFRGADGDLERADAWSRAAHLLGA